MIAMIDDDGEIAMASLSANWWALATGIRQMLDRSPLQSHLQLEALAACMASVIDALLASEERAAARNFFNAVLNLSQNAAAKARVSAIRAPGHA
jgi:hypothetical protein